MSGNKIDSESLHRQQVAGLYQSRLSHLKQAQLYVKNDKLNNAVDEYNKYLGIMLMYHNVPESQFTPRLFDKNKDLTELFLISHAYWDLAKIYDMTQNFHMESLKCLNKFIEFSQGYKYQHANAQIVRKYVLKNKAFNKKAFEDTYSKLQVDSKKCYVATMCFGEDDWRTNQLRVLKKLISKSELGLDFIDFYYRTSPKLVNFLDQNPIVKYVFNFMAKPFLSLISYLVKKYVHN